MCILLTVFALRRAIKNEQIYLYARISVDNKNKLGDFSKSFNGKLSLTTWKNSVQQLLDKLEELDTEPFMCIVIKDRLMSWPKVPKEKFKYDALLTVTRIALESQDKLGWKPFIYGRVATTWEDAQENGLLDSLQDIKDQARYGQPHWYNNCYKHSGICGKTEMKYYITKTTSGKREREPYGMKKSLPYSIRILEKASSKKI